jgi:hypothetical protein
MAFPKTPGLKNPKFGGKSKTKVLPPDKKTLESFGGAAPKVPMFDARVSGQQEKGFIQSTPKKATGAMMGRAPPPLIGGLGGRGGGLGGFAGGSKRPDSRKQFKPKGKKVF